MRRKPINTYRNRDAEAIQAGLPTSKDRAIERDKTDAELKAQGKPTSIELHAQKVAAERAAAEERRREIIKERQARNHPNFKERKLQKQAQYEKARQQL